MARRKRKFTFNNTRYTKYAIGALFDNAQKCCSEHPDLLGEIDAPKVLIDDLVEQYQRTGKAKFSLAAYRNISKDGLRYLTLTGKLPRQIQNSYPVAANTDYQSTTTGGLFQ